MTKRSAARTSRGGIPSATLLLSRSLLRSALWCDAVRESGVGNAVLGSPRVRRGRQQPTTARATSRASRGTEGGLLFASHGGDETCVAGHALSCTVRYSTQGTGAWHGIMSLFVVVGRSTAS